jgi:hypothetical protein
MNRSTFLATGCCAAVAGCSGGGSPAHVINLDARASQLRSAFNDHVGDVRLVLLVSPN